MSGERPAAPKAGSAARTLVWLVAAAAVVLAGLAAGAWWALRTSEGTAWLLGHLPGVRVSAPVGQLLGDFAADRLEIALPGPSNSDRIILTGVAWRGVALRWPAAGPPIAALRLDALSIDRLEVQIAPDPSAPPAQPPASLKLPLDLEVRALAIGEIRAAALGAEPVRRLRAHLHLADDRGSRHRLEQLSVAWDHWQLEGRIDLGSEAPYPAQAELTLAPAAGTDAGPLAGYSARATLAGTLSQLQVDATLRGPTPAGRPAGDAPALDLSAQVLPFAAWPLGALEARTQALDLSALVSAAPVTALSGSAKVVSSGLDRPAQVTAQLDNNRAGRWDEGLLPVRTLNIELAARPDTPTQLELKTFDLQLGTASAAAGALSGSGRWAPERATLSARLSELRPNLLDTRAPALSLGGDVDLTVDGLLGSPAATGSVPPPAPVSAPQFGLRGRLQGSLPWAGRQQALQVELDAAGDTEHVTLRQATARAGRARAALAGEAQRQPGSEGAWQVRGKGSLDNFDPALWWPGKPNSPWRQGPHRLNATLDVDLLLPRNLSAPRPLLAQLAAWRGQAKLQLGDSQLAGTPLSGTLALRGAATGLQIDAALNLAGSALTVAGQLDAAASGSRDHWTLSAKGVDLARLGPLLQLAQPAGSPPLALSGQLEAQTSADGRWPALATQGALTGRQLHQGDLQLDDARLRWQIGSAGMPWGGRPDWPIDVQAELGHFSAGAQSLDSLRLALKGTAGDHRLDIDASSPVRPPEWIDLLLAPAPMAPGAAASSAALAAAARASPGTQALLRAQGSLQFDLAGQQTQRWSGRLTLLELRGRGSAAPAWLQIGDTAFETAYEPATHTPRASLGAGRAQLPGAALRWSAMRWQGGPSPQVAIQGELEPIAVAPLLARLQPDFGWGGDLVVAGTINVRSAPTLLAEIEISRRQGDLNVADESGTSPTLPLGLTDLRAALDVHDGTWHLTQAFAGKTLGAMAGALTLRTAPDRLWPPPETPMEGVLDLNVANLATWGAWVPAGWRLGGALRARGSIGGRLGAPEFTGQIEGHGLAVRNLLEGIDLNDGEMAITLKGGGAHIDTLKVRAGDGSLEVSGNTTFGANPKAQLRLVAQRMLALGRVDRRLIASGQADLTLERDKLALDGQIAIDEGLIDFSRGDAPSLSDDVTVAGRGSNTPSANGSRGTVREVALNLKIQLGNALQLRGRGIDTKLRGDLVLTSPGGKLALAGAVRTADGHFKAYGQSLDIERGVVTFSGNLDDPRLDILAVRPNLDVRVGVAVTGTALAPRIRLYSDGDLSDTDKLSWLVLGRGTDGLGSNDTAILQRAAVALLLGDGASPTDQFTQLLGIDELSVRQDDTGTTRDTIVSLGKQLSRRWYVGYERGLNATAGTWQLIYRIAQRFTLRAQSGLDNSVDFIWTWRWK